MPLVFIFLWCLIVGDFKVKLNSKFTSSTYSNNFFQNFKDSRKSYTKFSAKDPINCYQNYVDPKKIK